MINQAQRTVYSEQESHWTRSRSDSPSILHQYMQLYGLDDG